MLSSPRLPLCSYASLLFALLTVLTLSACAPVLPPHAEMLLPFTSDGCTLFPDGTPDDRNKWCDCCQIHDLAYWQGGSADERKQADLTLRDCIWQRTGDQALAETIYIGVRAGGHPAFPTWYRWGYGWDYGRGYQPLAEEERWQVQEQIDAYRRQHPAGYCMERTEVP